MKERNNWDINRLIFHIRGLTLSRRYFNSQPKQCFRLTHWEMVGKNLQQLFSRRRFMSAPFTSATLRICVSALLVRQAGILFYRPPPPNVYSLIRSKPRNGVLLAQPGSKGFLRETFLLQAGEPSNICQQKANPSQLVPYRKLFSESNNFTPESSGIFMVNLD